MAEIYYSYSNIPIIRDLDKVSEYYMNIIQLALMERTICIQNTVEESSEEDEEEDGDSSGSWHTDNGSEFDQDCLDNIYTEDI